MKYGDFFTEMEVKLGVSEQKEGKSRVLYRHIKFEMSVRCAGVRGQGSC